MIDTSTKPSNNIKEKGVKINIGGEKNEEFEDG
jgi:hypothetical protein